MSYLSCIETCSSDDYKTSADSAKAIFSPDADNQYVCSGSADGNIYVWHTQSAKIERILREHR